MINTETKYFGLIGKTLKHSFSAEMHNTVYKQKKLNYIYIPIELEEDSIQEVMKGIKHMKFMGFNVTIPYKIKIMDYLDYIDPLAKKIGSVNTVKIENGKFKGYNTDGLGFIKSIQEEKGLVIKNNEFLILGAGGASRAIAVTLTDKGAKKIYIANRTVKKAEELSNYINHNINNICEYIDISDLNKMKSIIKEVNIIINTTSIGMYPNIDNSPISIDLIKKKILISDIVYNPIKTKLLHNAQKKGCSIHNGIGMLANQGAKAFEIWTGKEAPSLEMKKVLKDIINRNQEDIG